MSHARTLTLSQMSICVSLFDLHGPTVVCPILLYYTSLPLSTYSYPTKASTLIKAPFYSRHRRGHLCLVDTYLVSVCSSCLIIIRLDALYQFYILRKLNNLHSCEHSCLVFLKTNTLDILHNPVFNLNKN